MITPLYTVTVSPLTFTMTMSCVDIGDNSLDLWWVNPANGYGAAYFTISQGASITFAEFGGTWSDVSASSNLYRPSDIGYAVNDTGASLGVGALARTTLVPGATTHVGYPLGNANSGDAQCGAWIDYSLTYTLQVYATL
jgi:hypothetical protein